MVSHRKDEGKKHEDFSYNSKTKMSNLDFGDPLYLHPSDTSSTPIVSFKLKGTEN